MLLFHSQFWLFVSPVSLCPSFSFSYTYLLWAHLVQAGESQTWAKSTLESVFVNEGLLTHSHTQSFIVDGCFLSLYNARQRLHRDHRPAKTKVIMHPALYRKRICLNNLHIYYKAVLTVVLGLYITSQGVFLFYFLCSFCIFKTFLY